VEGFLEASVTRLTKECPKKMSKLTTTIMVLLIDDASSQKVVMPTSIIDHRVCDSIMLQLYDIHTYRSVKLENCCAGRQAAEEFWFGNWWENCRRRI
jgi:hypothetical protein